MKKIGSQRFCDEPVGRRRLLLDIRQKLELLASLVANSSDYALMKKASLDSIDLRVVIVLVIAPFWFASCRKSSANRPLNIQPHATIEFRWASDTPQDGYVENSIGDANQKVWVAKDAFIDKSHIAVVKGGFSPIGEPQLVVTFTEAGANRMFENTFGRLNRKIAILADGRVLKSHTITEPIKAHAVLSGWSGKEINWLTHYLYAPN